jgi:hypothetical protein
MQGHEIRVGDISEGAELALQPIDRARLGEAERLERDRRGTLAVEDLVHHAHPARAEAALDVEAIGSLELDFA